MSDVWQVALIVLWVIVLIQAAFLIAVVRQLGIIHERLPRSPFADLIPVGEEAPDFTLPDIAGYQFVLHDRLTDLEAPWLVLLFVDSRCEICRATLESVSSYWHSRTATAVAESSDVPAFDLAILSRGDAAVTATLVEGLLLPDVLVEGSGVFEQYGIAAEPFVLVLDRQGRLQARGGTNEAERIVELVRMAQTAAEKVVEHTEQRVGTSPG